MSANRMKAAVLRSVGQPLGLVVDIDIPEPRRGQVLVKLAFSGVCHSQIMEARGLRGVDRYVPHLLGHEGSGIVSAIGPEVSKVGVGDRVILTWIKGTGIDSGGCQYLHGGHPINAGGVTTFNEYALVSENRVVRLPEGVPMDVAVLFGCALLTGGGAVLNELQPGPDQSIAIFGLGGIGLCALMTAASIACRQIIAVDISEQKLTLARELGATHCINGAMTDAAAEILNLSGGTGIDYALDASGSVSVIEAAFKAVRRGGGLCVFASHPAQHARISIDPYDLICGKRIQGSWGGGSRPDRDIPRFASLYRDKRLPLERLITNRYSLDEINLALNDLEQGKVCRPLIVIDAGLA
jgi:S-(hydroxymethyl)glutathione dehydrogenase/alcohol dehydrogenase